MPLAQGVDMNTSNSRLEIAEVGEAVLRDNLLGLQVGNEPDLYGKYVFTLSRYSPRELNVHYWIIRHGLGGRQPTYSPNDYFGEFGVIMNAINNNPNIPVKNNIIGPRYAFNRGPFLFWV
jgi:hypothetical protein